MNTGARIAALGHALRRTAGEFSADINERHYLAHLALAHMLAADPGLDHVSLDAPDGQRQLRKALCSVELELRSTAGDAAAERRALLAP